MIDYKLLGSRIRDIRKKKGITQEKLAEAAGCGTTHISHIETGNSIPSLEVLINIINKLECSSDEILCGEIQQARPLLSNWLSEIVEDCSEAEIKLIADTLVSLKASLRRLKTLEYE